MSCCVVKVLIDKQYYDTSPYLFYNVTENVILQLDLLRNRFLKVELVLSFTSVIIAGGALVTGYYPFTKSYS